MLKNNKSDSIVTDEHIFELLSELMRIPGPSGHEEAVRVCLRQRWQSRVQEWQEDRLGNILCRIGGQGPKLLLQAHMDEISFVVSSITPDGFLFLDSGQDSRITSPAWRFMIGHTAQVIGRNGVVAEGVFATATGHVLTQEQLNKPGLDFTDFFVDIGVASRSEVEALGIHIGASVIWNTPTKRVGNFIVGKAVDDRMLLGILDLVLGTVNMDALCFEVWFGATVQEENGMHGARAIAHRADFDFVVSLDVGLVGDIPLVAEHDYGMMLGKGPTLVHKDKSIYYDKRILWQFVDVAEHHQIPFQHGIYRHYNSDASTFIDAGIPALLIGVPTRYTHSAFEMVAIVDIIATVHLLNAFTTTSWDLTS